MIYRTPLFAINFMLPFNNASFKIASIIRSYIKTTIKSLIH